MINDKRLKDKEKVIEYLTKSPFYKHAAWCIGKDEDTLLNWRKEDPDFSDRCSSARSECLAKYVNRASPDFILTHADQQTFNSIKKIDVTSGGKPISILAALDNVQHNDSDTKTVETS